MNKNYRYAKPSSFSTIGRLVAFALLIALAPVMGSCGPSVKSYVVDMRFLYVGVPGAPDGRETYTINVARFRDGRATTDRRAVGTVKAPWWDDAVPIVPKEKTPAEIVTDGVRAQLAKEGFTLAGPAPVWNLEPATLDKTWGRYVLGGVIEELYLNAKNDPPFCFYDASARLTFVMGNTETGAVKRFTVEKEGYSSPVTMNEESLERLINTVLSRAIAEGLYDDQVRAAIRDVSPVQPVR